MVEAMFGEWRAEMKEEMAEYLKQMEMELEEEQEKMGYRELPGDDKTTDLLMVFKSVVRAL